MDLAVLDPSMLYISDEEWLNEKSRDDYVEHFTSILHGINEIENVSLAWNSGFDDIFWSSPQKAPWRRDKLWSNVAIPLLYSRIQKNARIIQMPENPLHCRISPDIKYEQDDLYLLFLQLLSSLHKECGNIAICFGLKNIPPLDHVINVGADVLIPSPVFITCEVEFLGLIDVVGEFWPNNSDDTEFMKKGVSIILNRDYGVVNVLCDFTFSKSFIGKLSITINDREKILSTIAKRLSMTQAAAARDGGLLDEDVKGKKGIRRFRVTLTKRIHYKFNLGKIEFIMFYDDGEHDDGL